GGAGGGLAAESLPATRRPEVSRPQGPPRSPRRAGPIGAPWYPDAVNLDALTLVIALGAFAAGFVGALTGLGGGVVIVPLLTLAFGVDIRYAIGASLVSVIATSSAAAAAYVRDGYSNLRIGMFLEVATARGAVVGALTGSRVPVAAVAVVFGVVLLCSASLSLRPPAEASLNPRADPIATWLRMDSSYPTAQGPAVYHVARVPLG